MTTETQTQTQTETETQTQTQTETPTEKETETQTQHTCNFCNATSDKVVYDYEIQDYICPDCTDDCENTFYCSHCGVLTLWEERCPYLDNNRDRVYCCPSCQDDETGVCDYCSERVLYDELSRSECDGNYYCNHCIDRYDLQMHADDKEEVYDRLIGEYHSSKNKLQHRKMAEEQTPPFYLGFELEIVAGQRILDCGEFSETVEELNTARQELQKKTGANIFFERDSSVPNGLEIVSDAFSEKFFLEIFKPAFADFLQTAVQIGFRSKYYSSTGLHISLSLDSFSGLHLYRLLRLIFENPAFFEAIGGREGNHYCQFSRDTTEEDRRKAVQKAKQKNNGIDGRYTAVNICSPRVELRFPKGTLGECSFFANIENALALWHFTKKEFSISEIEKPLVYKKAYIKYISDNMKNYTNLFEILKSNELLPTTTTTTKKGS